MLAVFGWILRLKCFVAGIFLFFFKYSGKLENGIRRHVYLSRRLEIVWSVWCAHDESVIFAKMEGQVPAENETLTMF